jgi:ABC-type Zn uptake system ZnuABC Zn-binding protein ZnuA
MLALLLACFVAGCATEDRGAREQPLQQVEEIEESEELDALTLPSLSAVELDGRPLRVVATTSIIGDVVANVGGERIALVVLMGPGQDPHSYEPAAQDLTAAAEADVVFVNGWNLEQGLADDLLAIGEGTPVVPISVGIEPLLLGAEAAEQGSGGAGANADPHVWFSVPNVMQWAENVEEVLRTLDPANAELYAANAAAYHTELEELDAFVFEQFETIPPEQRVLVTNHDTFGYLADEYSFEVVGTVLPASSTLAEPSASDLAALVEAMAAAGACTIFTENTASDQLAQTVGSELADCAQVQVLPLYTDSLGPASSGAESYVAMMRSNTETVVSGLR